jgi:hypothetical protein
MARLTGPDESVRAVYLPDGKILAQGRSVVIYADADGEELADIQTLAGAAIADATLVVDSYSKIPLFKFPDGVDTVYCSVTDGVTDGPIVPLSANVDSRIDSFASSYATTVNIRQYGAVDDGTTDNLAAVQDAIDALPASGGVVLVPAGLFAVSGSLTLRDGITIRGEADSVSTIKQLSTTADLFVGNGLDRIHVVDMNFAGPAGAGTGDCFNFPKTGQNHVAYVTMRNVTITEFGGDAVDIENPIVSVFDRVIAVNCGGWAFNFHGQADGAAGTSVSMFGCYANGCLTGGYRIYKMAYCSLNGCAADSNPLAYRLEENTNVQLTGCGAEQNDAAVEIIGGYATTISSMFVYASHGTGVHVTGNAMSVTLIGVSEIDPGEDATVFLDVDTGSKAVIINCSNVSANTIASGTSLVIDGVQGTFAASASGTFGGVVRAGGFQNTGSYLFDGDAVAGWYLADDGVAGTDGGVLVSGALQHYGATAGFLGADAIARPTVTGSRGGNAALASLLTALASLGLITNSSSE